jgi:hypothetical protein
MDEFTDVDLACHRGGDERNAEFLEALDGVADHGDEGVDPRRLPDEEGGNGAPLKERYHWQGNRTELLARQLRLS